MSEHCERIEVLEDQVEELAKYVHELANSILALQNYVITLRNNVICSTVDKKDDIKDKPSKISYKDYRDSIDKKDD